MLTSKAFRSVALGLFLLSCGGDEADLGNDVNALAASFGPAYTQLRSTGTWSFVPVLGMTCADGSATGLGINLASRSSGRLLIYLEGGGGCWDASTCKDSFHIQNANLNGFDATTLEEVMVTGSSRYVPAIPMNYGAMGIWDRSSAGNPFRNDDYVYIPYCTADFHAGDLSPSPMDGLSHVGYRNMTRALAYLSTRFTAESKKQVVLCGGSAGGFGALWNFSQTQAAFGAIPVTLVAESGPPLPAPFLSPALEEAWRVAWGLDGTKSAAAPSTHLFPYAQWIARTYPSHKLAFVEMTGDVAVALFLGIPVVGANSLSHGLFSLRQQLARTSPSVSFFFIPSPVHTVLHDPPATWPAPFPPYGNSNLSLSRWLERELL